MASAYSTGFSKVTDEWAHHPTDLQLQVFVFSPPEETSHPLVFLPSKPRPPDLSIHIPVLDVPEVKGYMD